MSFLLVVQPCSSAEDIDIVATSGGKGTSSKLHLIDLSEWSYIFHNCFILDMYTRVQESVLILRRSNFEWYPPGVDTPCNDSVK